LRSKLSKKHKFRSSTDTEVLIHGYEEWGIDGLLGRINGMFAFCLYDKRKNICYLVRDRIGKKPLYYCAKKGSLAFASEFKSFFGLMDFTFNIDEEAFLLWMGFSYMPDNNKTLIKDVYKIPPAHYAQINCRTGAVSDVKRYWSLDSEPANLSFGEAALSVEELLTDAVSHRLVADVPVGILLSGGLDSSLITALASKNSSAKVKTINISFKGSTIDESKFAQEVSEFCHTDHMSLSIEVPDVYQKFKKLIWIYDDLSTIDGGLFSTYLLCKEVEKRGIKVVLVGEGADEVFGGYSWFGFSQYPFKLMPDFVKSWGYYYAIMRIFDSHFLKYSNILNERLKEFNDSYFKKIQRYEIEYSLPNHYCMKLDKGSMGASVEARAPFLDYRVVSMATRLPEEYLLNGHFPDLKKPNEKFILRKIAEKYLPCDIYTRKKKGGMFPTYNILNTGLLKDSSLVLGNKLISDFWGKDYLTKLISDNPTNPILKWRREWILWKCLVFSLWFDHYNNYENN